MSEKKIKICLDAGHDGKYNRSPANKAYYESDMNWKLHLILKKYLEQYGIEVVLTRDNQNTALGVYDRGKLAKGCDLFVSIHSNATGNGLDESVDYPVVIVPLDGSGDKIGNALATCVEEVMGTKQKGRIYKREGNRGEYYGVIRGAVAVGTVGIIIEHSFHTNTKSTNWLLNDDNLDKMAKEEAKVIADYFGVTKSELTDTKKEPLTLWYKVELEPEMRIETLKDYPAYNSVDSAKKGGSTKLTYTAGEYYVYKVYNGAVNITRHKGIAGAWVVL